MPTELTGRSDLAENRMARGMTLWSIESSTRIGRHFLEAIEAEDFTRLPGGVYTVSYLRQYARATGFDESALIRRYFERHGAKPEEASSEGQSPQWLRGWKPLRGVFEHLFSRESRNHA